MTREEAIIQLKGLKEHCSGMSTQGEICVDDTNIWVDDTNALEMAIKSLDQESKIEKEIREEIKRLSTYRMDNSTTDLVSLNAVERVLNLVFRGCRDKEPNKEKEGLK